MKKILLLLFLIPVLALAQQGRIVAGDNVVVAQKTDSLKVGVSLTPTFTTLTLTSTIPSYNGIATAGNGVTTIQGAGRVTAQTAAAASVVSYTVGSADASFIVSANVLVTASTLHSFTVTCAYTDEGNTARTITLNFQNAAGTIGTAIANAGGAVPYEGIPIHIRCKAATAITIATTGTFTTVTYNAEGTIQKLM